MNYLLITPSAPGDLRFLAMAYGGKQPIHVNPIPPVMVDGIKCVGVPGVRPMLMSRMNDDAPRLYRILDDLLRTGALIGVKGRDSVRRRWLQQAHKERLRGEVTILLVSNKRKIFLCTFNTDRLIKPIEIVEPLLYQSGNFLTKDILVSQITEAHNARLQAIDNALDCTNPAGLDLRLL